MWTKGLLLFLFSEILRRNVYENSVSTVSKLVKIYIFQKEKPNGTCCIILLKIDK